MISRNGRWAVLGVFSSLLITVAPAAERLATADAKPDGLVCRDVPRPGSHISAHVCATAQQWPSVQARLRDGFVTRENTAASIIVGTRMAGPPAGASSWANASSFQR